jgi:hypothetical protein
MADPFYHGEMPPVIRRTAADHYQLEGQSGVVIAEFNDPMMSHPDGWWSELVEAMRTNYSDPVDAIHDITLLSAIGETEQDGDGWTYIDDR